MYYIYKISNIQNNKMYVGKTTNSIENRFKRHINDALSNRLDTHLARAIRKYGKENFFIEEIDTAQSIEELNEKEIYWIKYYNSCKNGYNETLGGDGGNTYKEKTPEEMSLIKEKIRTSKLGSKNPNARPVKIKNVETGEELHFGSVAEVRDYFNHNNHSFVTKRCNHTCTCLWQGKWAIAYEEDEYFDFTKTKGNNRSVQIKLVDLSNNKEYKFSSYAEAERFFNIKPKSLSGKAYQKGKHFIFKDRFDITILN